MRVNVIITVILAMTVGACACTTDRNGEHEDNAAPAPYGAFSEGMIGSIKPEGWIREFLDRQVSGLTGHPEALCYPFNSCLWAGEITRETEEHGDDWWRYEQTAYYTDGLLRLGYLLDNEELTVKGEEGVKYTLEHLTEDGSYGFRERMAREGKVSVAKDIEEGKWLLIWPQAVFFRAIQAYYEKTRDERIPGIMERHFLNFKGFNYGSTRNIVNVEGLMWTYSHTGNPRLIELAEEGWRDGHFELNETTCLSSEPLNLHGVSASEELKVPILLYAWTGDKHYLELALRVENKLEEEDMLPDGVPSSAEHLSGKVANHSHETCDITDFSWSLGYYLMTTGEAKWGDKIERAVFNAGPGAVGKDFKTLQYFSSVNQFITTGSSNNNEFMKGKSWMEYRPTHETECCAGNVHRFMPNYVSRMWLRPSEGEIAAALFGPSAVSFPLPDKTIVHIEEKTDYPFDDSIEFCFSFSNANGKKSHGKHRLPFMFRIPEWAESLEVTLNGETIDYDMTEGGFGVIDRLFSGQDALKIVFESRVRVVEYADQGAYVERGPLLYSYPIPTSTVQDTVAYAHLNGKVSANPDFKCWSMTPSGKWNYALSGICEDSLKVTRTGFKGYPLDAPWLTISVPVSEIDGWVLDEDRYTPENPSRPFKLLPETGFIDLVPYGNTYLRLTVFPWMTRLKQE